MQRLREVTIRNDVLIAEMAQRADSLVLLTEEARERQHRSNTDIGMSLAQGDARLRQARDIVDQAHELSAAIAALELARLRSSVVAAAAGEEPETRLEHNRMRIAATRLSEALIAAGDEQGASELGRLLLVYEMSMAPDAGDAGAGGATGPPAPALASWLERQVKIHGTEQRALHDEVAELLAYSVRAAETEQATQNVAIEALRVGNRLSLTLANRDVAAAQRTYEQSLVLGEALATMPISPLIQSEMIDGFEQWRRVLATTIDGLEEQNALVRQMDGTTRDMIAGARFLSEMLSRDAERIGDLLRNILIFGAAIGLLLGSATGLAVARSITRPLRDLQERMTALAGNSQAGPIAGFDRRDELGDMARATNVFIAEIGRREQALRRSRDRADLALRDLQKAQTDLIQAEKLASLGQLVAGVAHEINTPLGIALTTSTLLGEEAKAFGEAAAGGKLQRSALERFIARMAEGTQLLFANLTRAGDLVYSFKQVAADQTSGESRAFTMDEWLRDLFTSLSPVLRKANLEVRIECPADVCVDTYPGALGQVLTNLVTNAVSHAYGPGETGTLLVRVSEPDSANVSIVFADDGRGIAPENIGKVFDPFFTTGRSAGNTGLGLHIAYNLVTSRLHGHIIVESTVGKGTRFRIDIPKAAARAAQEAPERRQALAGAR
jgi:signal transduction histidine kinase